MHNVYLQQVSPTETAPPRQNKRAHSESARCGQTLAMFLAMAGLLPACGGDDRRSLAPSASSDLDASTLAGSSAAAGARSRTTGGEGNPSSGGASKLSATGGINASSVVAGSASITAGGISSNGGAGSPWVASGSSSAPGGAGDPPATGGVNSSNGGAGSSWATTGGNPQSGTGGKPTATTGGSSSSTGSFSSGGASKPMAIGGSSSGGGTSTAAGGWTSAGAGNAAVPAAPSTASTRCGALSTVQSQQFAAEITAFFTQNRAKLNVLGTTVSPIGMLLDWIDPKSQSGVNNAAVPPVPNLPQLTDPAVTALGSGLLDAWVAANPNLVPIPRVDGMAQLVQAWNCMSLSDVLSKYGDANDTTAPPTEAGGAESLPDSNWAHHYATTIESGAIYGSSAVLSVTAPYVWRDDEFSLAQVALSSRNTGTLQTIEVGWQKSRTMYGDDLPHLFVYYTTNGYIKPGNNLGGYNRKVDGWQQVSHKTYPGDAFVSGSELSIWVHMYAGNWWIAVNGDRIGYYPGSLFAPTGLGVAGDAVSWYGEILDYRYDNAATYTQMGNGLFAGTSAAYIRNIQVESINQQLFYSPSMAWADKPNCYSIESHPISGTTWGSYFYFGGPGKLSLTCL
jgi:hypothetical protein